jgi:HK97 gp10 family phage protein
MSVIIRIDIKQANIRKTFADPKGALARGILRASKKVERKAKRLAPVDKGQLRASITSQIVFRSGLPIGRVGTNVKHAKWVHEGTGIYGPRGVPIRPKNGKVLVFKPKGKSKNVYVKSVKGMKGRPFLRDALKVLAA